MIPQKLAFVVLGFILSTVAAQAGSLPMVAPPSESTSPCSDSLPGLVSAATEGEDQELSRFLESLSPAPKFTGYQAEPGCWICYQSSVCCGCDEERAIISCDDYCGCP